jgi:uncharacterized SAM-binding protein YcdF (DUF218 family)
MFARIMAMFWGGFTLLNLVWEGVRHGSDGNVWWADLRAVPWACHPILGACGAALLAFAIRPPTAKWRLVSTQCLTAVLIAFALWYSAEFYRLLGRGEITTSVPVPLSLAVAASLGWILLSISRRASPKPRRRLWVWAAPGVAGCMVAFALLQMAFFGNTDYRRKADAIVVFGAGLTPEGQCSQALSDRVRTACELYRRGYSRRLILSGGPALGDLHETEAMRELALRLGVADDDIVLDRQGVSTKATVQNTVQLLDQMGARRVLAVSQGYHLPRVKMAYQREGLEVYTVPAETTQPLRALPIYVAREVAALWFYYFRPMGG